MTLIKDVTDCSTYAVRGLDDQLIAQMNKIRPGLLVRIDDLRNVKLADAAVHPWMQAPAKRWLAQAVAYRGKEIIINSAYRTLAGQMLLRSHYENRRCGIVAAAPPGKSNHNNASAIDVEDSAGWRSALQGSRWRWIGQFDPMHYDCVDSGIENIQPIAIKAFQELWNIARPTDRLAVDGDLGPATLTRLRYSPAEGYPGVGIPRILKLTEPVQMGQDIGEVQLTLRKVGIKVEKANQMFDAATDKAVREFQSAYSLVVDGIVGNNTRQVLFNTAINNPIDPPINPPPNPLPQDLSLISIGKSYRSTGSLLPSQEEALRWLQSQVPRATLDEFSRLWSS